MDKMTKEELAFFEEQAQRVRVSEALAGIEWCC